MQSVRDTMGPLAAVRIHKVQAHDPNGAPIAGLFGLRREGEQAMPGIGVGVRYTVLQDGELADIADTVARQLQLSGAPKVNLWDKGIRTSILLPLEPFGVGIGGQDVTHAFLRLDNPHGGGSVSVMLELLRQVCSNGRTVRVGGASYGVPHTLKVEERVRRIVLLAGGIRQELRRESERARALADRPMTQSDLRSFFARVHQLAYGPIQDPETGEPRRSALQRVADWILNLDHPHQSTAGVQGTAWAALNAVTQWADHEAPARDRRTSADHGTLARVKAHAYAAALELLG